MLYNFLKILMRITAWVFFKKITIRNKEMVPTQGPLIILANHPAAFLDPILIATVLKRKVFFLSKAAVFKGAVAQFILPKLNMIPVYRTQDNPDEKHKNAETFEKCYQHLENNGVILIFPEGVSFTKRKLHKIKTGAARIALGAEARNDFKLGVKIMNIGLNYADPHRFNQEVLINIANPIPVSNYKEEFLKDDFVAAEQFTEDIRKQLEELIIAIEDDNTDELVHNIETIYKHKLITESGNITTDKTADFNATKNIVHTVNYFIENNPERVDKMRIRIKNYLRNLNRFGLEDKDISINEKKTSLFIDNIKSLLFLIIGFPLHIYGLINNFIPFEIPGLLSNKLAPNIEFKGAMSMVFGTFTFLIFYSVQIYLVQHFIKMDWITILYAISLPISGFFTYYYWHTFDKLRTKWLLISLFYKRTAVISSFITEHENIILEIDNAKADYEKRVKKAGE